MKILIAGCGQVGETLARELSAEGHDLTLMDTDSEVLEKGLERYDVMTVQGNCASMKILQQANIEKADLLIAVTGSDELNLLCCMTAHMINPALHTIARIRDPEYTEQAYRMRDAFALSMIFNPEQQAAVEISRLLKLPGFFKRDSFAKGRVEIVELRVDADSKLCNVSLSTLYSIIKCRVLVCTVLRDGRVITPDGRFILQTGDRIFVTASADNLSTLLKNLGIVTHKIRRVIIAGGGKITYYLAALLKNSAMDVTVIEPDRATCMELASLLPNINVICGDAKDRNVLESEGIEQADALISLTDLDELNMIISLYGHRLGLPVTVACLEDADGMGIVGEMSIGSVVCPQQLCCNTIVRYVRAMQKKEGAAISIHAIADGRAEAMEFCIDSHTPHCGVPLKKLSLKKNVLLVGISNAGGTSIPNGDSYYSPGDHVVVVSSGETVIRELGDIFA